LWQKGCNKAPHFCAVPNQQRRTTMQTLFSTHALSQLPGGQTIVIELANGHTCVQQQVKYPAPYIKAVLEAQLDAETLTRDHLKDQIKLLAVGKWVVYPKYHPGLYKKLCNILKAHESKTIQNR
jgi:hypothetical protein